MNLKQLTLCQVLKEIVMFNKKSSENAGQKIDSLIPLKIAMPFLEYTLTMG